MSSKVDAHVARILDRTRPEDSDDDDALLAELEDDEDNAALSSLRERRLEQLHQEMKRAKLLKESQHGTYLEIKDEKQLMEITTSTKLCVVHFMKPDFNRCRIMDGKLASLAEKHYEARFVSINVDNAPFLVVKLGIQVLPCVISFVDGVGADRIVGFEGVGRKADSFTSAELEARLLGAGVLVRAKVDARDDGRSTGRRQHTTENRAGEDDDDLWD